MKSAPPILGLTGGIGSGKSKAASFFRDYGIPVIDADQIARDLRNPNGPYGNSVSKKIEKYFGTLDSKTLRERISKNPNDKASLEKILHPEIKSASETLFHQWNGKVPFLIYEAALLLESGGQNDVDQVIFIKAPLDARIERICTRDRVDPPFARQLIDTQWSDERKEKLTHFIIENNSTLSDLREKVRILYLHLLSVYRRYSS